MNDSSVILPVYNRPQLLMRALESISRQTLQPTEVIVVDDGSDESLESVLQSNKKLPITFFRLSKNSGAGAARNAGIKLAQCQLIAFLDSDDEWLPNKLEKQVAYHNTIPGLISTTGFEIIHELHKTRKERIPKETQTKKELQKGCFLSPGSTMLVNRTIFSKVGKYDIVVLEVNKVLSKFKEKSIHVSGQVEKGISAFYAQKYFKATKHLAAAIKLSPLVFVTVLVRCLNALMRR